jgi:hypothetical protein
MTNFTNKSKLFKAVPTIALEAILILFGTASANAQYQSDVEEVLKGNKELIYCANLFTEINKQESAGNYTQARRLRQQYAYSCTR